MRVLSGRPSGGHLCDALYNILPLGKWPVSVGKLGLSTLGQLREGFLSPDTKDKRNRVGSSYGNKVEFGTCPGFGSQYHWTPLVSSFRKETHSIKQSHLNHF